MKKNKLQRRRDPRIIGLKHPKGGLIDLDSFQMELDLGEEWRVTPPSVLKNRKDEQLIDDDSSGAL